MPVSDAPVRVHAVTNIDAPALQVHVGRAAVLEQDGARGDVVVEADRLVAALGLPVGVRGDEQLYLLDDFAVPGDRFFFG